MNEIYLTTKHAAHYMDGFAHQTLVNWRHQKKGPRYIRIGRSIRYRMSDLDKFMNSKLVNHVSEMREEV